MLASAMLVAGTVTHECIRAEPQPIPEEFLRCNLTFAEESNGEPYVVARIDGPVCAIWMYQWAHRVSVDKRVP